MQKIEFGSTGLVIEKNGFGCLPIQRISETEAVKLLHKACDGGINFFDTARAYSDSEQKVGAAFSGMRDRIVLATKTGAQTAEGFWRDLETSLRTLKTDYIDIYQFHNPAFCPKPGGEDGLYDAALEAKKQGKIRHISITNHRLAVAQEAIDSGLYASLQFPFSYLAGEQELALVEGCRAHGMGFIAMKGMAGGLLRDGLTAAAWMAVQENVVPIWGVQRESELDQFLQCIREGTELTDERRATIERDRRELCGEFCRGCGYCMPCPAGIEINQCARMSLMLRRAPAQAWLTEEWQARNAPNRAVQALRTLHSKVPLRPQHPGAAAGKLQGLLGGSGTEPEVKPPYRQNKEHIGKAQGDSLRFLNAFLPLRSAT